MKKPLDIDKQQTKLKKLHVEWSLPGDESLHRVFNFDDFKSALKFVNKVGEVAESVNHHPEIKLEWGKVELVLRSHDAGGVTDDDFSLAAKIDELD